MVGRGTIHAALANALGGLLVGFAIGYVPVAMQYEQYVANCTRYTGQSACDALSEHSGCIWGPAVATLSASATAITADACNFKSRTGLAHSTSTAAFPNGTAVPCTLFNGDEGACAASPGCFYDNKATTCEHNAGWTAIQDGLFAAMLVIGSVVGAGSASFPLKRLGRKGTLVLVGSLTIIAVVGEGAGWAANSFALYVAGRFLCGLAMGIVCVASPMYCGEACEEQYKGVIGVTFQLYVCFGILIAGVVGVIISPQHDVTEDENLRLRLQALNAANILIGLGVILVGCVIRETGLTAVCADSVAQELYAIENGGLNQSPTKKSDYDLYNGPVDADDGVSGPTRVWTDEGAAHSAAGPTSLSFPVALFVAVLLAAALQMTGINAVMNYAPRLTSSAGLAPLTGNCIVAAWNFVSAVIAVPIARKAGPRQMFLTSAFFSSLACLLTALPMYPGILGDLSDSVRHPLILCGILFFVLAFECGTGPGFYVLAQAIFSDEKRDFGCSFANVWQYIFNVTVVFCYPIAVQGLSGGKSGNQEKGQGIALFFFGGLGMIVTAVLFKLLPDPRKM
jgi:hypothetical protein